MKAFLIRPHLGQEKPNGSQLPCAESIHIYMFVDLWISVFVQVSLLWITSTHVEMREKNIVLLVVKCIVYFSELSVSFVLPACINVLLYHSVLCFRPYIIKYWHVQCYLVFILFICVCLYWTVIWMTATNFSLQSTLDCISHFVGLHDGYVWEWKTEDMLKRQHQL